MRKALLSIAVFVLAAAIPISVVHAEPRTAQVSFEQIRLEQVKLEQGAFDAIFTALKANTVRSADTPEWGAALKISQKAASGSCLGQQASAIVYSLIGWANRAVSGWKSVERCDPQLIMPGLRDRSARQLDWYQARAHAPLKSGHPIRPVTALTRTTASNTAPQR